MAPITSELATLRALTFRISSTATSQLPQHVPAVAASLASCRTLLSSPQASASKTSSDSTVALHKYRTLLSTLLQDRTIQGRWAAVVLIKATVEIGGWEILQKSLPWVRGLLGILNKPDPPTSKKLCIITLTRIFILTREYPTLVREITTPSLPAFIQYGLQIANSKAPASLLQIILESFNELLPRHHTTFRTSLKQLNPLLVALIAPTPSNKLFEEHKAGSRYEITTAVIEAAQQLYVQLPCCAPKGAPSEEWEKSLKCTVQSAHRVADKVFRAVLEDWQPASREAVTNGHTLDDEVQDLDFDNMGLPVWSGIFAGSERLVHLLRLTQQYLANSTPSAVSLNISAIMDLITRVLSLTLPGTGGKSFQTAARFNNQVSKEERENLWMVLPDLHVVAVEILLVLANRSQSSTLPLDALIIDQLTWVFASEQYLVQVRTAVYHGVKMVLQRSGTGLSKSAVDSLVPLMRACCEDLLPTDPVIVATKPTPGESKAAGNAPAQTTGNADTFLNSSKAAEATGLNFAGLTEAAHDLLPVFLADIRAQYLSDAMRSRLDRTATLTQHKTAMLASVLNPPPSKRFGKPAASILPLMARLFAASQDIEGLLRPRMPVIRLGTQDTDGDGDDVEDVSEEEAEEGAEEEEEEEDEEMEEPTIAEEEESHFVGHELDSLLQSAGQTEITVRDFATLKYDGTVAAQRHVTAAPSEEGPFTSSTQDEPKESVKRPQLDQAHSSPSKKAKTSEGEHAVSSRTRSASTVEESVNEPSTSEPIVVQTSGFAVTSTSSAILGRPEPGKGVVDGTDSDEDDVVSLVLGVDTDEESE